MITGNKSGAVVPFLLMTDTVVELSDRYSTRRPRHSSPHARSPVNAVRSSRKFDDLCGGRSHSGKVSISRRCSHHTPVAAFAAPPVYTSALHLVRECSSMYTCESCTSPFQKPEVLVSGSK